MFAKGVLLSSLVVALCLILVSGKAVEYTISEDCLNCLCQATSKCNPLVNCTTSHCGPFFISRAYWVDSGRPVLLNDNPNREGAFMDCVTDMPCAADTIDKYVRRFRRDCNGDGVVSCIDYAYTHSMGPNGCKKSPPDTPYFRSLNTCIEKLKGPHTLEVSNTKV
ncbi:invertebrate-type lysozyme 6-like [Oratosquilla oratoria]|uniref:invertebrate-type lysozyme 6-like n=1 Tax=Oratosquilla oratoria TaxID=337810 RepID=UPI003F7777D1